VEFRTVSNGAFACGEDNRTDLEWQAPAGYGVSVYIKGWYEEFSAFEFPGGFKNCHLWLELSQFAFGTGRQTCGE
jgi:hypothetical protein